MDVNLIDNKTQIVHYQPPTNKYNNIIDVIYSIINYQGTDNVKRDEIIETQLLDIKNKIETLQTEEEDHYQNFNLNQFNEISLLKSGGFGIVFQGLHILDSRKYAIKLIPLRICKKTEFKELLISKIREIRYLSNLNHTNIIRYHNSWIERDNTTDLFEYIKKIILMYMIIHIAYLVI